MPDWKELFEDLMSKTMKKEACEVIEKKVVLDLENFVRLRMATFLTDRCKNNLQELAESVGNKIAFDEKKFWDEVAGFVGYDSMESLFGDDKGIRLDWGLRTVCLTREEKDNTKLAIGRLQEAKGFLVAEQNYDMAAEVRAIVDKLKKTSP